MPGRRIALSGELLVGAIIVVPVLAGSACEAQAGDVVAIHAGRIVTAAGADIQDGMILVKGGKITAVGAASTVKAPAGAHVIDARSRVVMPGLVAAFSTLGGASDSPESVAPDVRAIDGFDFFGNYRRLLQGGLTTVYLSTGTHRLVSGQGGVVKLFGDTASSRTVSAFADVRVSLGDLSKTAPAIFRPAIPPSTDNPLLPAQRPLAGVRPAEFALLRQLFRDAREFANRSSGFQSVGVGASDAGLHMAERRLKLDPVHAVVVGDVPLRVIANTASDIRLALQFATDQRIKMVIEGAAEGGKIAPEIAARHIPVIAYAPVDPSVTVGTDFERDTANGKRSAKNIVNMVKAGVSVALMPPTDASLNDLLMLAAAQNGYGLSADTSIKLVTRYAAEILGVGKRLGTVEVGKDADLLILSGAPLATGSAVEMTLVGGKVAYERTDALQQTSQLTAIRAGRVFTVSHGIIENGVVLVRDGKIVGINRDGLVPPGAKVIEAPNSSIMPGMIDAYSYLGLHTDTDPPTLTPASPVSGPVSGRTKLQNSLRAHDAGTAEALAAGVTEILLAPPAGGNVSGVAALLKTIDSSDRVQGPSERVVREAAAVVFNATDSAPRMAQPWVLDELLQGARAYSQRRLQYIRDLKQWEHDRDDAKRTGKEAPPEPAEITKDEDQEAYAPLFRNEIPAFVHVQRYDEIMNVLKVFRETNDLSLTLVGASDAYRMTEELRRRNVNVAQGPDILKLDHGKSTNAAAALGSAGVHVTLVSGSSSGTQFLRLNAANAVRHGMDPVDALKSITLSPASALHVQERLGSIDAGKDADLVILSGDPLELTSRVEKVIVNGRVVYDASKSH